MKVTITMMIAAAICTLIALVATGQVDPQDTCSPSVAIFPYQDGEYIGNNPIDVNKDVQYFVLLQLAPDCDPITGGTLTFIWPDGLFTAEVVDQITVEEPFVGGPYLYTPRVEQCPLLDCYTAYRPAGQPIWAANTRGRRDFLSNCPCSADTDNNGMVDVDDLVNVILQWGCTTETQAQEFIPDDGGYGYGNPRIPYEKLLDLKGTWKGGPIDWNIANGPHAEIERRVLVAEDH